MKVTIIIPLRVTDGVYQAEERLKNIISNVPENLFNILIINYGTPDSHKVIFANKSGNHIKVIDCDTQDEIFNIGHARDLGVQHSEDDVVFFNDIDFFGNTEMYTKIYNEVISREMHTNGYDFFCIPVFFLTENGSKLCLSMSDKNEDVQNSLLHRAITEDHKDFVDFPAYGSSAIVVNKNHYLAIGGHSREFFGHGAEDYDVLHRLSTYYSKGPRTANYYLNTKSNKIDEYKGFRAYFSLNGIDIFNKGIFFAHLWHPKRAIAGYHQTQRNFSLLDDLMKNFDKNREQPYPLGNLNSDEKWLILIDTKSQTFKAFRHALPALGQIEFQSESTYKTAEELVSDVEEKGYSGVLFLNPYGNEHRLSLYRFIKEKNIPYIVFDRGALPNSWFFDPNGFNYESSSYSPDKWNVSLSQEEQEKTLSYLLNLINSEESLETQSSRKTSRYLKEKYQIGNRKVVFVPFQRPTDTVTTYFSGAAKSVSNFQNWVQYIASNLPEKDWVIICKNHPLDKDLPKIDGVIYADTSTHIHDLIDLSDKVLLMNSGVGLISLAFNKPVICCSESFYAHDGLAYKATNQEQALDLLKSDLKVSKENVIKFYNHIINNVYSFGISKYRKTKASDGSDRSIVTEIIFDTINMGSKKIKLGTPPKGVSLDAPIFYSFGGRKGIKDILATNSTQSAKNATVTSPKPKVTNNVVPIKTTNAAIPSNNNLKSKSKKSQKFKKLISNPSLFFKDAIINRKIKSKKAS